MKKTITILILFISINSYCQKKDDTIQKKDTVETKADTLYYIILKKAEFENLINVIKQLDEKPSIIREWLNENIFKKTQLIAPPPSKEKQKK